MRLQVSIIQGIKEKNQGIKAKCKRPVWIHKLAKANRGEGLDLLCSVVACWVGGGAGIPTGAGAGAVSATAGNEAIESLGDA